MKSAALIALASGLVAASPFPDPFDRRYADNAGLADSLAGSNNAPHLAARQAAAPTPPANLPNATGLSYAVPAPQANGGKAWKDAHDRARGLVNQMTLEEKVGALQIPAHSLV